MALHTMFCPRIKKIKSNKLIMRRWVDSAHLGDPHSLLLMGTIFTINLFFFLNLTKNATQQNKSLYVSYVVMLVSSYQPQSAQITL